MLVLSRREDDKILLPNLGITVQILRVEGQKVRVRVDAPREVKILRHELSSNDDCGYGAGTRETNSVHAEHLRKATQALSELSALCNRELDCESEKLVLDVFRHLKSVVESPELTAGPPTLPPAKEEPHEQNSGEIGRRIGRALLVEDSLNESRLLADYFRTKQFEVALAGDGQEALDYLEANQSPDIGLLDMQMPGMDGAPTIGRLRSHERHRALKVFAVSGGNPSDYGVKVGPEGVDGWFPKPLDPAALAFRLALESNKQPSSVPA